MPSRIRFGTFSSRPTGAEARTEPWGKGSISQTRLGLTLYLLHVVETAKFGFDIESEAVAERLEGQANEIVTEAIEAVNAAAVGSVTSSIAYGQPYREISSYVEVNDIDLVAIGTHGRTDFSRYTLGGVSSKISGLHQFRC